MKEASAKCSRPTSPDTRAFTCSLGSAAGTLPFSSPGGPKTSPSGQDHAPVSRSAPQESDEAPPTSDTCGPRCTDSSQHTSLQLSLESRLRARLDASGSPEYSLKWKHWDIDGQEPICALRASARRTSGNDYSGWQTPKTPTGGGQQERATSGGGLRKLEDQVAGIDSPSFPAGMAKSGGLNPSHSRWLMGYPPEWCDSAVTATPSSRS